MNVGEHFIELKERILRTILVRRITLGIFAVIALVVKLTSGISYLNPLFYAPLVWFLLTFPFQVVVRRQQQERTLHWVHAGFFIVEITLITLFVHLMGGSEWIGNIFYLFTVIYANFFLPRLQGYFITGLVILLYAALVLLEYAGVVPHRSLFAAFRDPYRSFSYTLTTILAGMVGIYVTLAYTVRSFTEIYTRKNRALAEREAQLAELSKRLLSAQEEERRRIARELHDELGQSLAAVKLHLASLQRDLPDDRREELTTLVDRALEETRTLAYSLRPPLLDDLGLVPSLRRLTEMVEKASGLVVTLEIDEGPRPPKAVENLFFHVVQEAMTNVREHAQAKRVVVGLHREQGRVSLSVEDDGIGFRPEDPQGLGLQGIRERVEMSGGRMTIASSPGQGALITVEVSCSDADSCRHSR
jgi:signal transduction histidine kinase